MFQITMPILWTLESRQICQKSIIYSFRPTIGATYATGLPPAASPAVNRIQIGIVRCLPPLLRMELYMMFGYDIRAAVGIVTMDQ